MSDVSVEDLRAAAEAWRVALATLASDGSRGDRRVRQVVEGALVGAVVAVEGCA